MCWNPTLLQCRTRSCIVSQFACRRSSRDRLRFNTLCCDIGKCEVCEIVCGLLLFKERQRQQPVCDLATRSGQKCKQRSVQRLRIAAATRPWIFLDISSFSLQLPFWSFWNLCLSQRQDKILIKLSRLWSLCYSFLFHGGVLFAFGWTKPSASWCFMAFSCIFTSELRLHCPSLANHGDLQCTETAMEFSHVLWQWRAECL